MTYEDFHWAVARVFPGSLVGLFARGRAYGAEHVPRTGGAVYAITHLHWLDVPLVGWLSPRNVAFVAKIEATRGPLGRYVKGYGTIAIRRGESDRDAIRRMRQAAAGGKVVGVFVEGTRQRAGVPGKAQPGAAMVAIQEGVPLVPVGVYGTPEWRFGNFRPCTIAFGAPMDLSGLPKNGRGYKEGTREIELRLRALFDWLAEVDAAGRPRGPVPP